MEHTMARVEDEERLENVTFGMWLFIASEIMFFTPFFAMYIIMRNSHPEFVPPHTIKGLLGPFFHSAVETPPELNVFIAAINTFILVTSSFFMTNAVNASKAGDGKKTAGNLVITALFGLAFLGLKAIEYVGDVKDHLLPSTNIFYSCYYTMTGFHGLHILIGVVILLLMSWRANRGQYTKTYNSPVEMLGLYWCLVEVVWFFLFPVLYLV